MRPRIENLTKRIFSNWHAKVIALVASLFIFIFYRLSTQREILVPLQIALPSGYEVANERPESIRIIMRGSKVPENLTKDNFKASVDLSSFSSGGTVRSRVEVERLGDAIKLGALEFDPQPAEITFVLEPAREKYVPVNGRDTVGGAVSHGYVLESIVFTPANVLLRGPKSRVDKIAEVTTEKLDVSGKSGAVAGTVRVLTNDAFVRVISAPEVKVTLVIGEKREKRLFEHVAVTWSRLKEGLAPTEPREGSMELEASLLFFEGLDPAQLKLVADCAAVNGPGEYSLEITGTAPPDAVVADLEPKSIVVRFEKKP